MITQYIKHINTKGQFIPKAENVFYFSYPNILSKISSPVSVIRSNENLRICNNKMSRYSHDMSNLDIKVSVINNFPGQNSGPKNQSPCKIVAGTLAIIFVFQGGRVVKQTLP